MSKHKPFKFYAPVSATITVTPGTRYAVTPDADGIDNLITIWPGKAPHTAGITCTVAGPTDEGYHSEQTSVQRASDLEWDLVYTSDSRDCDGRSSHYYTGRGDGTLKPGKRYSETRESSTGQRDYAAEAAGY